MLVRVGVLVRRSMVAAVAPQRSAALPPTDSQGRHPSVLVEELERSLVLVEELEILVAELERSLVLVEELLVAELERSRQLASLEAVEGSLEALVPGSVFLAGGTRVEPAAARPIPYFVAVFDGPLNPRGCPTTISNTSCTIPNSPGSARISARA